MARRRGLDIVRTPFPRYIKTEEEAEDVVERLYDEGQDGIGFDTETTGLDVIRDRVRFFSFAVEDIRICAPVRLMEVFAEILEDPNIPKRMTNAKYDMHMAMNHGIHVRGKLYDTVDMDFLYDENRQGRHGLKQTAKDHLGLVMSPFKVVFGNAGSTNDEVRTLVEIHDILERHDDEGDKYATDDALRMLIRLSRVKMSKSLAEAFRKLDLSMRAGYKMDSRKVLKIARDQGLAKLTPGTRGYIQDMVEYLGGPLLKEQPARRPYMYMVDDPETVKEMHHWTWELLLGKIGVNGDPIEVLRTMVTDYASLDAWASYKLVPVLMEKLGRETMPSDVGPEITLAEHYETDRSVFIRTLWNMERRGFRIDKDSCKTYGDRMEKVIIQAERDLARITKDVDFNPNSPVQLRSKIFEKQDDDTWLDPFGDPPKKMTGGGTSGIPMPSTAAEVLEGFAGKGHELSKTILKHRQFVKLRNTYMVKLPTWADIVSRIHTNLRSSGAVTWRIASREPNLMNIPSRDPEWGPLIRNLFIAGFWGDALADLTLRDLRGVVLPDLPKKHPMKLIVADYKQLEMRIMAHFAGDPEMIEAIEDNKDLHCQTVYLASQIGAIERGITYDMAFEAKKAKNPTDDQKELLQHRKNLKSTGFGIIYGIGALKLGMQLGLPISKRLNKRSGKARDWCQPAADLIKNYLHGIYPGVGQFIDDTHEQCREELVVHTLIGHPRRLPDIASRDRRLSSQAERQSVNSRIQGTAADIVIKAMLRCESDPVLRRLGVRMLLQVHDELIFEVPDDPRYIKPARKRIKELMEDPYKMKVPVEIDMDEAYAWGDAH